MNEPSAREDFLSRTANQQFRTILADPPWQFQNRTGKVAPEHRRLNRYGTMTLDDIKALPVEEVTADTAHLYLWVPNALLPEGLAVLHAWGLTPKTNPGWHKKPTNGAPPGRGGARHRQRHAVDGRDATEPPGKRLRLKDWLFHCVPDS